jgi:hypothetical protein
VSDQDKDKRIEELTELLRCVRVARDLYRSEIYALKDRISELEQTNDALSDDNMNLSAMNRSAYARMFAMERAERERTQIAA